MTVDTQRLSSLLAFIVLAGSPGLVRAGPYGIQIPDSESSRSCKRLEFPEMSRLQRVRSHVGFGAQSSRDGGWPFTVDVGMGFQALHLRRKCHRRTTGLFASRTHRTLGFGPSVRGAVVPGRLAESRVSGGLQVSYDGWTNGLLDEFNPIGVIQLDVGPSFGADGLGVAARLGFFGIVLGGSIRYEHLFDARGHLLAVSVDLANLHLLPGIPDR